MCLLITQSEQSPKLSNAWLEDFYDYNGDGVGVMFVENGSLIIGDGVTIATSRQVIPRTEMDLTVREFFQKQFKITYLY